MKTKISLEKYPKEEAFQNLALLVIKEKSKIERIHCLTTSKLDTPNNEETKLFTQVGNMGQEGKTES